jgi:hypothetical protein
MNNCPKCGGPGTWLGNLGRVLWLRCRNCGWTYTAPPINHDDEEGV